MRQSHGGFDDGAHGDGDGGWSFARSSLVRYTQRRWWIASTRGLSSDKVGHAELDREARACEGGR